MSKISVDQLNISLSGRSILQELSFQVEKGEFVGLIGPNGSGKSTLLKALDKSLSRQSGEIHFNGQNIDHLSTKEFAKTCAIVAQEHNLAFDFKVIDLVQLSRFIHHPWYQGNNQRDAAIVQEALEKVGLVDLQDKNYFNLSGGEQQRVMIARALAKQVDILLLDEPSNHLDINYQLSILKTIKQEGLTVFTSLHDLNLAARFCDRLILLNQGSIVLNGPTEEVLTSSQLSQVFKVDIVTNRLPNGCLGINYL